jgi:hypothetical protein
MEARFVEALLAMSYDNPGSSPRYSRQKVCSVGLGLILDGYC